MTDASLRPIENVTIAVYMRIAVLKLKVLIKQVYTSMAMLCHPNKLERHNKVSPSCDKL